MIPKIIHFVWVGKNPKPDLVLRCIESWKRHCPDYKIMEWNDDSLKDINNTYVKQAYEKKKWAFVSDYIRLYALNKYGGFYFDSDLEITQSIDSFHNNKFITGYEKFQEHISPVTALMGAEESNEIVKFLLDEYQHISFIKCDGSIDYTTNTVRITKFFANKYGITAPYDGTKITALGNEGVIYPYFYFCTLKDGEVNYSIHHFSASWHLKYQRIEEKFWKFFNMPNKHILDKARAVLKHFL